MLNDSVKGLMSLCSSFILARSQAYSTERLILPGLCLRELLAMPPSGRHLVPATAAWVVLAAAVTAPFSASLHVRC